MTWTAATVVTQAVALLLLPCIAAVLYVGLREAMKGLE